MGAAHTFDINKDNGATVVHISVYATPWILSADLHTPVTLDVPNGTTLYTRGEPFELNPTKNVKLGKVRAISWGDATDYVDTDSGTGILDSDYTFEVVKGSDINIYFDGLGGCISYLAIDVR